MERRAWVVLLVSVLLVAALVAFGRGVAHHRGDDVGALGAPAGDAGG